MYSLRWNDLFLFVLTNLSTFWLIIVNVLLRIDGKPEDVLNPKKKQLEKITPVGCSSSPLFSLLSNLLLLSVLEIHQLVIVVELQ